MNASICHPSPILPQTNDIDTAEAKRRAAERSSQTGCRATVSEQRGIVEDVPRPMVAVFKSSKTDSAAPTAVETELKRKTKNIRACKHTHARTLTQEKSRKHMRTCREGSSAGWRRPIRARGPPSQPLPTSRTGHRTPPSTADLTVSDMQGGKMQHVRYWGGCNMFNTSFDCLLYDPPCEKNLGGPRCIAMVS